MSVITIPKPLREKLGEDATDALIKVINESDGVYRKDLATKEDLAKVREDIVKLEGKFREEFVKLDGKFREELVKIEARMNERFTKNEGELVLIKYMVGLLLAGVISLIMKAFF